MAKRRMFTMKIVDSDAFLDMPLSAQALYFHLSMRADDDGFVDNPKKIKRMIGASDDDASILINKKFIIAFESGIIVIKHWKMHNYIQSDRYEPTPYEDEKNMLTVNQNKSYSLLCDDPQEALKNQQCIQNVSKMDTQVRLGKVSIGNKKEKYKKEKDEDIEQIVSYLNAKANVHYRPTTKATREHISARLDEGYTTQDFERVIDNKVAEWKGTDYEKFLRPQTLFSPKHFESYLNQHTKQSTGNPFLDMLGERND